jgi:hypothetical protein
MSKSVGRTRSTCECDAPVSFVDGTKNDDEVYEVYKCDACGERFEVVENTNDGTRYVAGERQEVVA